MRRILSLALLAATSAAFAQTYGPGIGGSIPDSGGADVGGPTYTSDIVVAGGSTIGSLVNVSFEGLTHTFVGDLLFTLTHVNTGTTVDIIDRYGRTGPGSSGNSSDFTGGSYTFVGSGGSTMATTGTINPGIYNIEQNAANGSSPANNPFTAFAGESANGTWRLTVQDFWSSDTGSFNSWSFTVAPVPEPCSMLVMGAGIAGVIARRRRSKKA